VIEGNENDREGALNRLETLDGLRNVDKVGSQYKDGHVHVCDSSTRIVQWLTSGHIWLNGI
jgi:hypothetical protein